MKILIAALFILSPVMAAQAGLLDFLLPPPPSSPAPAVAPEIDGAAGALAIALVGGGLALLKRARRPR